MSPLSLLLLLPFLFLLSSTIASPTPSVETLNTNAVPSLFNPKLPPRTLSSSKKFEGSSDLVRLRYHMGPVLSSNPINIYIIWYGRWALPQKLLIKDFLLSISTTDLRAAPSPSVAQWWRTVSLYTDQTGANVSRSVVVAGEHADVKYSNGNHLTRLSVQQVIANAVRSAPFPVDHKHGIYLILTSDDVTMQDFCRAVCGFHYFTFPSMVGHTLPYAWIGNSAKQCPEVCAYPFVIPGYMGQGGSGALSSPSSVREEWNGEPRGGELRGLLGIRVGLREKHTERERSAKPGERDEVREKKKTDEVREKKKQTKKQRKGSRS